MRFSDQVVWITGASAGIGAALARAFSADGAAVVLSARREGELEAVRSSLERPDDALVLPVDLLDEAAIPDVAARAVAWRGRVDVVVHNAGMTQRAVVAETPMPAIRRLMELNFFAPVALTQALLPHMVERGSGRIVAISSVAGYVATPKRAVYAASKHALRGFFDGLRAELHGTGVGVTVACPGYVDTGITESAVGVGGVAHGRREQANANGISAERCAAKIVDATAKGRREVAIGGRETWAIYAQRLVPGIVARAVPGQAPE